MQINDFAGTVLTIIFINTSFEGDEPQALVCQSRAAFARELQRMKGLAHIKVLHAGLSAVKTN